MSVKNKILKGREIQGLQSDRQIVRLQGLVKWIHVPKAVTQDRLETVRKWKRIVLQIDAMAHDCHPGNPKDEAGGSP